MALINILGYPILVQLEHNGTPIGQNPEGDDIFEITKVHWLELAGQPWQVHVESNVAPPIDIAVASNEASSKNLPGPQRFPSEPLRAEFTVTVV